MWDTEHCFFPLPLAGLFLVRCSDYISSLIGQPLLYKESSDFYCQLLYWAALSKCLLINCPFTRRPSWGKCGNGLEYEYCLRIDNKIFTQCALVLSMAYININLLGRPKAELSKLIYSGTISEKEELLLLGEGKWEIFWWKWFYYSCNLEIVYHTLKQEAWNSSIRGQIFFSMSLKKTRTSQTFSEIRKRQLIKRCGVWTLLRNVM